MSSADKMKIELKRVRDEFKMSESDCGSSRVQGKSMLNLLFFSGIFFFCLQVMIFFPRIHLGLIKKFFRNNRGKIWKTKEKESRPL